MIIKILVKGIKKVGLQKVDIDVIMATKDGKQKVVSRAIKSVSNYNVLLNRQRPSVYIDLQTDTQNFPVGLGRQNKTLTKTSKIGRFPVAVLPHQYQDWFIEYTPSELDFLPVDTILKGPIMSIDKLPPVLTTPEVSDFETDSCCSSCCSSGNTDDESDSKEITTSQTTTTTATTILETAQ